MARLTSEFWVQAYIRRAMGGGAFAGVQKRGATEAGSIFVIVDRLDGSYDLFGPAPQSFFMEDEEEEGAEMSGDRAFEKLISAGPRDRITERLEREKRFDGDLWIVEVEDRGGRSFLDDGN